jgi:hypothetical protein
MLASTGIPANARGVKLPCRHQYAPFPAPVCRIVAKSVRSAGPATPAQLRQAAPAGRLDRRFCRGGGCLSDTIPSVQSMLVQ